MRQRGFTLIELLVVIAIIGILSAVVLASLGTARDKGTDAAIKSNLKTIQTQAELWYSGSTNGYGAQLSQPGGCKTTNITSMFRTTAPLGDSTIIRAVTAIENMNGSGTGMHCGISAGGGAYAVQSPLVTSGWWCIDSSGFSGSSGSAMSDGATVCPP